MTTLPDLFYLLIEQVGVTNVVTISVRAAASYPCCGSLSKRIHSHYQRTLRNLPASGRPVHLNGRMRRFFCQESSCRRKIFAERFPSLTLPCVKFTLRLQQALREMGFELGEEACARLGKRLSYPGSPDTILWAVKQDRLPTTSSPWVVCIDDWSWKLGLCYGTFICNLENNRPIDLFADRSVETVSTWFEKPPSVEIVSRDRSSQYAAAISKSASQVLQVADLWHIAKNLPEHVQTLYNYLATLRTPQLDSSRSIPLKPQKTKNVPPPLPRMENFSAQRATWLFVRQANDLDETHVFVKLILIHFSWLFGKRSCQLKDKENPDE